MESASAKRGKSEVMARVFRDGPLLLAVSVSRGPRLRLSELQLLLQPLSWVEVARTRRGESCGRAQLMTTGFYVASDFSYPQNRWIKGGSGVGIGGSSAGEH